MDYNSLLSGMTTFGASVEEKRDFNDRLVYCGADIKWIEFIIRLKGTDMLLKEIRRYARLRTKGDSTISERLEMLIAHKANLEAQIEKLTLTRRS